MMASQQEREGRILHTSETPLSGEDSGVVFLLQFF